MSYVCPRNSGEFLFTVLQLIVFPKTAVSCRPCPPGPRAPPQSALALLRPFPFGAPTRTACKWGITLASAGESHTFFALRAARNQQFRLAAVSSFRQRRSPSREFHFRLIEIQRVGLFSGGGGALIRRRPTYACLCYRPSVNINDLKAIRDTRKPPGHLPMILWST